MATRRRRLRRLTRRLRPTWAGAVSPQAWNNPFNGPAVAIPVALYQPVGMADAAVAQQKTTLSKPLVSNLGQPSRSGSSAGLDFGQQFTTGSNSDGYTLTGVTLKLLLRTTATPTYHVRIEESNQNFPSTTVLGTLTNPPSLPTDATAGLTGDQIRDRLVEVEFKAPDNGIRLSPQGLYFVVFDVTAANGAEWYAGETTSDDEDPDAESGWSITSAVWRNASENSGNWSTSGEERQIAVHGNKRGGSGDDTISGGHGDDKFTGKAATTTCQAAPAQTCSPAAPATTGSTETKPPMGWAAPTSSGAATAMISWTAAPAPTRSTATSPKRRSLR